jgi:hypothetical protein
VLDPISFNPPQFGHGAISTSVSGNDTGPQWTVLFRPDLSWPEQEELWSTLTTLPAVTDVRYCDSPVECGH